MTRIVMCAIPSREAPRVEALRMMVEAVIPAFLEGVAFVMPEFGGAPISVARNTAAAIFLNSKADDLFFIDDDVKASPAALVRMVKHDADFVGGVYPHRVDGPSFPLQWHAHGAPLIPDPDTGLLEVHGIAAGFMRVRRCVIEKMVAAYPDDWYWQGENKIPNLFDFELRDHMMYSEDFGFCKKWRDIGGKVWIDPEIGFTHTGPKAFFGHLGNWLRTREHSRAEIEDMAKAAD